MAVQLGEVIRGLNGGWRDGLSPWQLLDAEACYYGGGVAENKGQHSINPGAR